MDFLTVIQKSLYYPTLQSLVFFLLLIVFLARKLTNPQKTKVRQLPPGPRTWPIVGNLAGMLMNRPTFKWIHRVMDEMETEIACFRLARVNVVTVTSDVIAREAFKEKDAVFGGRPETYSSGLISGGFKTVGFSHYGDQWKKMRRVMALQVMSPKTLNMLLGERTTVADNLLAYVHNICVRGKTVNVRDVARTYGYVLMTRMMFGGRPFKEVMEDDDGGLGPMEKEHVDAIFKMMSCVFSFRPSEYIPCISGWGLDREEKMARVAGSVIGKYIDGIVDQRIESWTEKGEEENVKDWLDILVAAKDIEGKPLLTPEEIKAECMEIYVATLDNQPNNVEWTLAEMLNRPEMLRKAVDELDEVVGRDRLVQESDVPKLNYIKACSRESFRLHPVAPFLVPHVAVEDTTLAGYFIPKGSHILMSRLGLGRNPKIWDEPFVFKPERHLGCSRQVSFDEPEMRFVSFSTGRRGCVGSKVGTCMTVMLLARLLQGFDWSLPPGSSGRVELAESETNMFMAKPLLASVRPRLSPHMYPRFQN